MEKDMRKEAYRLTGFTVVISALGFLLRWLQDIQIIEPETGLARRGAGISVLVVLVIAVTAAVLGFVVYRMRRYTAPTAFHDALAGDSVLYTVLCFAPAVLLALAGIVQLMQSGSAESLAASQQGIRRISGIGALAGAVGAFLLAAGQRNSERAGACRVGSALIILFGGLWLICGYKSAAADPVIWRFAVEMLAICAALMAFYHLAGYFYGEPSPLLTIFYCHLGGFLCIMSAVDEHTLGETVFYGATALLLLVWGFILTVNLRRESDAAAAERVPGEV